eukprot:662542-Pelagomonas_calceolata.AAC.1
MCNTSYPKMLAARCCSEAEGKVAAQGTSSCKQNVPPSRASCGLHGAHGRGTPRSPAWPCSPCGGPCQGGRGG